MLRIIRRYPTHNQTQRERERERGVPQRKVALYSRAESEAKGNMRYSGAASTLSRSAASVAEIHSASFHSLRLARRTSASAASRRSGAAERTEAIPDEKEEAGDDEEDDDDEDELEEEEKDCVEADSG
jgi:hypothetical protein